jgi:hypothetical protein
MIKITGLLMLLYTMFVTPDGQLKEIREMFYNASESRKAADEFKDKMRKLSAADPVLLGYKAMSDMLQANYSFNPVNKITYFNRGKELLEKSIAMAPGNSELRFLRFSIQTNAPSFLAYRSKIDEDKGVIFKYLKESDLDKDLERRIKEYLLSSKYCTDQEKKTIQ